MDDDFIGRIEKRFDTIIGAWFFKRLLRFLVGIIPPVGTLLLTLHCLILLLGLHWHVASSVFKISLGGFVLLIVMSKVFGYCWLHRSMITYNFMVSCCIEFQYFWSGFGRYLTFARVTMFLLGVVILTLFFKKRAWSDFVESRRRRVV